MNIIDEIGILAISTRLQRLSEQLRKDGAQIYSYFNIDFEPKWFPVIYTLHVKEMLSVVEIASEIGYSHPSTISLLKELEKELIKAGSSMEKVLKVNVYLADLGDYKQMNEVFKGRFGPKPPVRTTVATYGGVPGNSLVEMDCIAIAN